MKISVSGKWHVINLPPCWADITRLLAECPFIDSHQKLLQMHMNSYDSLKLVQLGPYNIIQNTWTYLFAWGRIPQYPHMQLLWSICEPHWTSKFHNSASVACVKLSLKPYPLGHQSLLPYWSASRCKTAESLWGISVTYKPYDVQSVNECMSVRETEKETAGQNANWFDETFPWTDYTPVDGFDWLNTHS